MDINHFKHQEITEKIIKAFYTVYNTLGYGFLEKVYENSLYEELLLMDLTVEQQPQIIVNYKGNEVGNTSLI